MGQTTAKPSPAKPQAKPSDDPVDAVFADNPDVAEELQHLTRGEQIVRLRQRGLIGDDVQ